MNITAAANLFASQLNPDPRNQVFNRSSGVFNFTGINPWYPHVGTAQIRAPFLNEGSIKITRLSPEVIAAYFRFHYPSTTIEPHDLLLTDVTLADSGSITGPGQLELAGAVTLTDSTPLNSISKLEVSGTANVPSAMTLSGVSDLEVTGTIAGAGSLVIPANVPTHLGTGATLDGVKVINQGAMTAARASLKNGAVLENAASIVLNQDALITDGGIASPGQINQLINNSGATLSHTGTPLASPTAPSSASIATALRNDGVISIASGQLRLADTTFGASSSVTGAGTLSLSAESELPGTSTFDGLEQLLIGGVATLTSPLVLDGLKNTVITGTVTGVGPLTIPKDNALKMVSEAVLDGMRLINSGEMSVSSGGLKNGAVLENSGVLALSDDATIADNGVSSDSMVNRVLNNSEGTISYAGSSADQSSQIVVLLENDGLVSVTGGTLLLKSLLNLRDGVLTKGSYFAEGATLTLPQSVTTNAATVTIRGAGAINDGTANAFADLVSNIGTFDLGRELSTSADLANSGMITLVEGGTLTASAFSPTESGILAIAIKRAVKPGTDYGQLVVSGVAALAGTLALETSSELTPEVGTVITILSAELVIGTFRAVSGASFPGGEWVVAYTPNSVVLTATSTP